MLVKLIAVLLIVDTIKAEGQCNIDVQWNNFNGPIPDNALKVTSDADGNPIYLGFVGINYYDIIPAIINHNSTEAVYSVYGKRISTTENIKILCTDSPSKFDWQGYDGSNIEVGHSLSPNYVVRNNDDHSQLGTVSIIREIVNNAYLIANDTVEISDYDTLSYVGCNN